MPSPDAVPGSNTDAPLVRALRSGDPDALQTLMHSHWEPLVAFAHRRLQGAGDPQDIAQTAFVRLWARRAQLDEAGSLRALLFTIVRNACLDELRKRQRRKRAQGGFTPHTGSRTPYEDVQGAELHRLAASAVAGLPERRREVFRLVREEGLSYREVAEILELSPQTVANHMSLAMADLRASLRPYFTDGQGSSGEQRDTASERGETHG